MRSRVRVSFAVLVVSAFVVVVGPAVAQASFGVEKFVAVSCLPGAGYEGCAGEMTPLGPLEYWTPKEPSLEEAKEQGYTQAAGHPGWGITAFNVKTQGTFPNEAPEGIVEHIRTDVAPGVSTNPEAVPQCSIKQLEGWENAENKEGLTPEERAALSAFGFYPEPECKPETEIGVNDVTVYTGSKPFPEGGDLAIKGTVYNLEQPEGRSSDFGAALELPKALTETILGGVFKGSQSTLEKRQYYSHTMIEGGVEWGAEAAGTGKGDYHDYYEIHVSPALPLIASRLVLKGNIGTENKGGFITNPSNCAGPGPATTSTVALTSTEKQIASKTYTTPIGTEGCDGASPFSPVPFLPEFFLKPETTQQDQPDGITTELKLPHDESPEGIDTSQLKTATVTLPEGMTLNPSAAGEITEACTPAQARIHSETFGVTCPAKSKIGTVALEVPTLPPESLQGNIYLGGPEGGGAITGPPYTIYLNAESTRYGVDVRLEGTVTPNETTGQLTATFADNPEQPFTNAILRFNGGALAPLANPLACGTASPAATLIPYIGSFATSTPTVEPFTVDSDNKGGTCASPVPFSLSQSVVNQPPGYGGAKTSYTLNLQRGEGQQYLSQIKTVLPPGLVGLIPAVTRCGEPQASKGECPETSKIGRVDVSAGAGTRPYGFVGNVYLTGPYGGAPFGLSVVVPAVAGPFDLGNVVTRGTIEIEPYTAQVVVTSTLPTIVKGIPLRLRGISVEINKQGFLENPTNCAALNTETTLSGFTSLGTAGTATQTLSSPFQVSNCSKLAFKPEFKANTGAKATKANGASLETTLKLPAGAANVKSVLVQLPRQLPSRLTTLQKACLAATFEADFHQCPAGSFVGTVTADTPTLPAQMKGPAILVSHGGEAFPDLDLVLEGEGVRVILVGHTKIRNAITTTDFSELPDAPVTSVTVHLPVGPHSALAANGNLCARRLNMPTTIVAQNGAKFKQKTRVKVRNCPVRIVGRKVVGNAVYLTVQTYAPGRISGSGRGLRTVYRHLKHAHKATSLVVPLSNRARLRHRPFKARVRVGFFPKKKHGRTSAAHVTVRFR
jgi:hypothetical protein